MNNKFLSFLGLAKKAGKLDLGRDAVYGAIHKKSSKLVLLSCDLSKRTMLDITQSLNKKDVNYILTKATMDEFSIALGKRTGIISVNDESFAKKLAALVKNTSDMEVS